MDEELFRKLEKDMSGLKEKSEDLSRRIAELQTGSGDVSDLMEEKEACDELIAAFEELTMEDNVTKVVFTASIGWILGSDDKETKELKTYRRNEALRAKIDNLRLSDFTSLTDKAFSTLLVEQPLVGFYGRFTSAVKWLINPSQTLLKNFQQSRMFKHAPRTPYLEIAVQPAEVAVKETPLPKKRLSISEHRRNKKAAKKGITASGAPEKVVEKNYEGMITLKKWLVKRNIIEIVRLNVDLTKGVLSNDFRMFLRGLVDELGKLHRHGFIHGSLTEDSILVDEDSPDHVQLLNSYKRGNRAEDFKALKQIIEYALSSPDRGSLAINVAAYPEDLSHYIRLLEVGTSKTVYYHSCLWSCSERLYLIEQFANVYYADKEDFKKLCSSVIPADVSARFRDILGINWIHSPKGWILTTSNQEGVVMVYQNFYKGRENEYRKLHETVEPLIFMRNADLHIWENLNYKDMDHVLKFVHGSCTEYMAYFCDFASSFPHVRAHVKIEGILDTYFRVADYY